MLRIICVRTGDKFSQWYEDNLKHMIDNYSNLEYDEFVCIREDKYDANPQVFNKLQMFDTYRNGTNIYFDLDVLIKGDCNHLLREDFTLCYAWWRKAAHTPLNSSVVSWKGDVSHISKLFLDNPDYFMLKYYRGIDQYIYENFNFKMYYQQDGICSYHTQKQEDENYSVYLFNQQHDQMFNNQWYKKYFL